MLIRRMTVSDAAKVAAIEAENFSQPWSENSFIKAMESPDNILVVAQDEKQVIINKHITVVDNDLFIFVDI